MFNPDLVNGCFELGGSALIWLSVRRLWKDKMIRGYSPWATAFFAGWGYWNLFYYPHLAQWWSFAGGVSIVVANTAWISLMWKYRRN